jgi:peptidoglycan/LPS O-acetylase OafA/YrhL
MRRDGGRIVAIDMAKGIAIVWVILIHAEVLQQRWAMDYLVNHAVPIFLVLFGVNAEQWWRRHGASDLGLWYRRYLRRILLPVWGMLPVWWLVGHWLQPERVRVSWRIVAANLAGYLPNVGTAWFVTLILQLVLVFPLLHWAAQRIGGGAVLAGGLVCLVATVAWQTWLWWRLGPFNLLAFAPRMLGHVTFGLVLASRLDRLTLRAGLVATLLWALLAAVQETAALAPLRGYAERLMDLPLTVALLVLMDQLAGIRWIARPLAWLGVNSYGLYIGQMLVHNLVLAAFDFVGPWHLVDHWTYAALLLIGALAMLGLGYALLGAARRAVATLAGRSQQPGAARA